MPGSVLGMYEPQELDSYMFFQWIELRIKAVEPSVYSISFHTEIFLYTVAKFASHAFTDSSWNQG